MRFITDQASLQHLSGHNCFVVADSETGLKIVQISSNDPTIDGCQIEAWEHELIDFSMM